jgi:predicted kinase
MSVPFAIASLHAYDSNLRERIRLRRNDASEADVAVLDMLRLKQQPLSPRELTCAARFTTEETPDSAANSQGWDRLAQLL